MTIKIIDDTTVEVDGIIGVFKQGGYCSECLMYEHSRDECADAECVTSTRDGSYIIRIED